MKRATHSRIERYGMDGNFFLTTIKQFHIVGYNHLHLFLNVKHLTEGLGHRYAGIREDIAADSDTDLSRSDTERLLRHETDTGSVTESIGILFACKFIGKSRVNHTDLAVELLTVGGYIDIVGCQGRKIHILIELNLDTLFISSGFGNFRLLVLDDTDVHVKLWRRYGQPFAECGLITVLLEFNLPETLRHIPLVHTVFIGEQRILLSIFLGIPKDDLLIRVAVHILFRLLIID